MVNPADRQEGSDSALPSRGALAQLPCRVLHPGSATKAAVRVYSLPGGSLLVKDVAGMQPLIRAVYGRPVVRREARALAALAGMAGVPQYRGQIDRDALAMEFMVADTMSRRLPKERLTRACVALAERVAALHARGVVHLDLRQKRNVLVDAAGEVVLIDFQSALVLAATGWRGWLLRRLAPIDRSAVLKYRSRYAPESLNDEERQRERRRRWFARLWFFHRLGPLLRMGSGRDRRSP